MKFWYWVCYFLARVGLFFWHPVFRVTGRENIPEGRVIFCANHSSGSDPLWVLLAIRQPNLIRIMAKQELRKVPFIGWMMEKFRIIFVNRGGHDTAAVDACVRALKNDEKLLLFIEGTRCRNKHVRAKTGAIRMAVASGAPILPVYITRNKTLFGPIDVIIGQPRAVSGCTSESGHEEFQMEADRTLYQIYEMGGDSYADHISKNCGLLLRS